MNIVTESEEMILNLPWQNEKLTIVQMVKALEKQNRIV